MKNGLVYIFVLFTLIALAAPTKKQLTLLKNDVYTVKSTLKSGKDLDKSEETMRKYLADPIYSSKEKELQRLLCDVLKRAYEVGNEKMYLKTNPDTASLVKTGRRMFLAYQRLDSLDAADMQTGIASMSDSDTVSVSLRKEPASRRRNSAFLLPYRTNIFMGGLYFLHKKDWENAWQCFDLYLECPKQPLFSLENLPQNDSLSFHVAYLSLISAIKIDSLPLALKYDEYSIQSHQSEDALQQLAMIAASHKDFTDYEIFLRKGFYNFPNSKYFFPHLVDLLSDTERQDAAREICDSAVAIDSTNTIFLLAQHSVLMNMNRYDEAIKAGNRVLAVNDTLGIPNYNIGFIYHQRAMNALNAPGKPYRQRLQKAQQLLRLCRPYMERYRSIAPYDRKHWRPILYDVYLNLNLGKEFAEVENK